MAGENEAYGSVYKGQEGTGDAFIIQGADDPIKAYALAQKENEALKLKAQNDISKFGNYIVGGYTKHHDMLAQDQLKIAEDYKNLLVKHNGQVPATDMVDLNTRKSQLQGLAKVSDKMTDYVKAQTLKYQSLGPDKQQGWDKVQEFINETDPKKQLDAFIGGNVPLVTEKPKIYDWTPDAISDKTTAYIEHNKETDKGDTFVTTSGKTINMAKLKNFATDYALSGLDADRHPEAASLIIETKAALDKDPVYKSIIDPASQQQYMLDKARDAFMAKKISVTSEKSGVAIQEKRAEKEDKDAWKTGNGYATRGNFIVRKQNRPSIYKGSMAPDQQDPNSVEYSVGQKNGGNNPPLTFQDVNGSDLISFTTKKPVKVDTGVNNPTQLEDAIKTHDFVFKDYVEDNGKVYAKVVSKQGIGYTAGSNATPFEIPAGTYLIPIDKARGALVGYPTFEEVKDKLSESDVYKPSEVTGKSSRASGSGTPPIKNKKELADKFGAI